MKQLQVAVADLDALSQAAGVKLDGILGCNYLKLFRVTIDYSDSSCAFEQKHETKL